jgi:hypothetical protein
MDGIERLQEQSQRDPAAFDLFLKVIYFCLLASVGLYWVALVLLVQDREPVDMAPWRIPLIIEAAATFLVTLYLRYARIGPLLEDTASELTRRLSRLRFFYILSYVLSESVALVGFALAFLAANPNEFLPFFAATIVLFLLCYPQKPKTLTEPIG